jgi:hypothetical protein
MASKGDIAPVPTDGGKWTFQLANGETHQGDVMERHDNLTVISFLDDKGQLIGMNIMNAQIVHCWMIVPTEITE